MFRFTFRIIIALQFKDIDLSDKHVKILAVLKPQLDRNYPSQTPTKIILQVAHLQLPPETPKPYSAPCLEYHWIQTNFCQVHGMEETFLKLCSHRCSFAIHLLSLVLERQSGTRDMGLEERRPEVMLSTAAPVLSQNQSFPTKLMSPSVHSSETTSTACLSSHL